MSLFLELNSYFQENRERLEAHYPGINQSILRREFHEACGRPEAFSPADEITYLHFISGLSENRPLEHLSGQAAFRNLDLFVNDKVLVPRSETELLVEFGLEHIKSGGLRIADVGTGSGAIPLSLLSESGRQLEIWATDISPEALEVAKINAFHRAFTRCPESRVHFLKGDRLEGVPLELDMIISNPPYIKEQGDRHLVADQVLEFEPHEALFLPDSSYDNWFEGFFEQAYQHLVSGGLFVMEGHEDHLDRQVAQVEKLGFVSCEVLEDYTGRKRFLKAYKG